MKKVRNRALTIVLIIALILFGTGSYIYGYITEGESRALYFARSNSGCTGEITDRYGTVLADYDAVNARFSDDKEIREACYHITGDYWGRTGTGLLNRIMGKSSSFDLVNGIGTAGSEYIQLTADAEMCRSAYRALQGYTGCMMVMNYKTGEVLCMVSTPCADPIDGESPVKEGAFINRCLSAVYTPGSCFKLVTTAAALETVPNLMGRSFYCEKEYEIAGVTITCTGTHYTQDLRQALANSCNIAFAQISVKVGQDNMIDHVRQYGFLDNLELDGIRSAAGNYPLEFVGDPELAWSGIGQSTDLICPYAMLRYVSALANGGVLVTPHIIRSDEQPEEIQLVRADTADTVRELMLSNVTDHYDPENNFPGLRLGAKTGTAELGDGTSHAWFTGFLDDEAHPYAFVVLIEHGGGGLSTAGKAANKVLQTVR